MKELLGYETLLLSLVFHKVLPLCLLIARVLFTLLRMMHATPRPSNSVKYYYIRDTVVAGEIMVKKIHTLENPTDMLTKPLALAKFKHCLDLVSVHNI